MPKSNTKQSVKVSGYRDAIVQQVEECVDLSFTDALFGDEKAIVTMSLFPREVDALIVALESAKEDAIAFEDEDTDEVSVRPAAPRPIAYGDNVKTMVQGYIDAKVPIVLDYTDVGHARTTRTISPREVATTPGYAGVAYLRAWDHDAEEYRSFRLSRINGLAPSVEEYVSE